MVEKGIADIKLILIFEGGIVSAAICTYFSEEESSLVKATWIKYSGS